MFVKAIQHQHDDTYQCRQTNCYPSADREFVCLKQPEYGHNDACDELKEIKMIKNTEFAFFNGIHIGRNTNIFYIV